jgi:hypothetical protein
MAVPHNFKLQEYVLLIAQLALLTRLWSGRLLSAVVRSIICVSPHQGPGATRNESFA